MTPAADTSFLVSLYGGDANTRAAREWMAAHATPVVVTEALLFETENALRLACFRKVIGAVELRQALTDIASDSDSGILLAQDVASARLWSECRRLSFAYTLAHGTRSFDILHVAAALALKVDTFLSFDKLQRKLADAVGLHVAP